MLAKFQNICESFLRYEQKKKFNNLGKVRKNNLLFSKEIHKYQKLGLINYVSRIVIYFLLHLFNDLIK